MTMQATDMTMEAADGPARGWRVLPLDLPAGPGSDDLVPHLAAVLDAASHRVGSGAPAGGVTGDGAGDPTGDAADDRAHPGAAEALVLEAALVGPTHPAERRIVEVLARAEEVVAERSGPRGVERVVRVAIPAPAGAPRHVVLRDAGARTLAPTAPRAAEPSPGRIALPPVDSESRARTLCDALGVGVVLVSRAGEEALLLGEAWPTDRPVADGTRLAAALDLLDTDAALVVADGLQGHPADVDADHDHHDQGHDHDHHDHDHDHEGMIPGAPAAEASMLLPPLRTEAPDGTYEAMRRLFGLRPGTPEALEIGLPRTAAGRPGDSGSAAPEYTETEPVDDRIERACRLARLPLPEVDAWHPVRRHVRTRVDLAGVVMTVRQLGVLVEAPDDLTLGVAVGRLVLALAAEGVPATPIQHEVAVRSSAPTCTALVAFLGDDHVRR